MSITYVRPDHTPIEGRCRSCGARYYAYGVDTGLCCKRACSHPVAEPTSLVAVLSDTKAALESLFNDLPFEKRVELAPLIRRADEALSEADGWSIERIAA